MGYCSLHQVQWNKNAIKIKLKNKLAKLQRLNPSPNKNAPPSNKIVNLFNYKPSPYELAILEKGLSFCRSKKIDEIQFFSDIESYFCHLRLKEFFCQHSNQLCRYVLTVTGPHQVAVNKPWIFISNASENNHMPKLDQKSYDNISCKERAATQSLKRNKNIIIKPADKGRATVILNRSDYIKEGKNQLNHQPLSLDLTKNFNLELTKLIKSFPNPYKSLILHSPNPQPGKFYLLPKIHKLNNPGRSIISNNNTLIKHLSHFVETLLKPYEQAANSFIQHTTDFLNKLKKIKTVPQNTILAILDISSLYTNITHNNRLKALKH